MTRFGPKFENFGALLYYLRTTHSERVARNHPDMPIRRIRLTQAGLIACLERSGYSISSGAYSEIEQGISLPRDPERFIGALSTCLELNDNERSRLARQLARDAVKPKLGDELTDRALWPPMPPAPRFGAALRRRRLAAGMTQRDLAECLINQGFSGQGVQGADDLPFLVDCIDQIESGAAWPLGTWDVRPFIEGCVRCLYRSDDSIREEFAKAMADDLLDGLWNWT